LIGRTKIKIAWDKKYEIGHQRIDFEHHIFFDLVTTFSDKIALGATKQQLMRVLREIGKYADFHFTSEENIMEDCSYPERMHHAKLHATLLEELHDKYDQFSLERISAKEIFEFLFNWFSSHASQEDKQLAGICFAPTNITELNNAKEEFYKFFNLTADLACIASTTGYFLKINPRWQEKLGYSEQEILSTSFLDFVHPEDKAATVNEVQNLKAGKTTIQFTNRYRCKDGSYIWLEWNTSAGEGGKLFALARDITERKQTEAALHQSELSYRSLFEHMLDSVAHCRIIFEDGKPVDMEYLSVNPAFAQITGLNDVVGRRINDVIPDYSQDNPESIQTFCNVATDGIPRRWEHYLGALNRWFSFSIYSLARGEVVIISCDITERKRAEQKSKALLHRYQTLMKTSLDGIHIMDIDGNVLEANDSFCRMLGYTQEEMARLNASDWDARLTKEELRADFRNVIGKSVLV
jgi:hemerythrin-like metal-binding protein/PAS domain S-box-containing protein